MRVILGSASPRRKELLKHVIPKFEIIVSDVDEKLENGLTPNEQVTRLAKVKAKDVFSKTNGNRIVIGSDTIVIKNGKIYGKPKDKDDAKEMIKELISGDGVHSVITGVCIIAEKDGNIKELMDYDEAKVYLKNMTDDEINNWINSGQAMDKAGAYGIQNEFGVFVEKIDGNYTTVVGLPIHKVYDMIKQVSK